MSDWKVFLDPSATTPPGEPTGPDRLKRLPKPPPWRDFGSLDKSRGETYRPGGPEIEVVNAALYLRRPVLVTGRPGGGKSSLAYAVAKQLGMGSVLRWSINSRSTLAEGLYQYDAISRLRDASLEQLRPTPPGYPSLSEDIGRYIRLGPLGTALLPGETPRVLLIDEIDKSDIDLPNDLLHVFEEGRFEIPELKRLTHLGEVKVMPADGQTESDRVAIQGGLVRCKAFPFVVLTSNGERDMPQAFFRRCLRLEVGDPDRARLESIIEAHLDGLDPGDRKQLLETYLERRDSKGLLVATDQLLNALFLVTKSRFPETSTERASLIELILKELDRS